MTIDVIILYASLFVQVSLGVAASCVFKGVKAKHRDVPTE